MELLLFLSAAFTLSTAAPNQHRHIRWDPYHCCTLVGDERSNSTEVIRSTVTYKSFGRDFFIWTHYVCSLGHFLWHAMLILSFAGRLQLLRMYAMLQRQLTARRNLQGSLQRLRAWSRQRRSMSSSLTPRSRAGFPCVRTLWTRFRRRVLLAWWAHCNNNFNYNKDTKSFFPRFHLFLMFNICRWSTLTALPPTNWTCWRQSVRWRWNKNSELSFDKVPKTDFLWSLYLVPVKKVVSEYSAKKVTVWEMPSSLPPPPSDRISGRVPLSGSEQSRRLQVQSILGLVDQKYNF